MKPDNFLVSLRKKLLLLIVSLIIIVAVLFYLWQSNKFYFVRNKLAAQVILKQIVYTLSNMIRCFLMN